MSSQRDISSANRVFVGGISWKVFYKVSDVSAAKTLFKADESSLADFFATYGAVLECKIIMDKVTGKSKGFV